MTVTKFVFTRPWMYEKQRKAFFNNQRYSWIEGSTKSGKTVACIAWLFEQAIQGKPGWNYLWIAPIYPQAKIAFRRFKRGLPDEIWKANEAELFLTLANGATIWFKGGDNPDSIYGEDYHAAVIDEASRCKDEVWTAVRSTLTATQGPVRAIGNVKGRGNFHYRMCRLAEGGAPNMSYHKITAIDAVAGGIVPQEEIDDARRQLPDHVFRELYLAEPAEDGNNPFGFSNIKACIGDMSDEPPVVIGVDLAESVDWTVAVGLDRQMRVCGVDRFQLPWPQTKQRLADLIRKTPALVDQTGVGKPVVADLQTVLSDVEGFQFTQSSKQELMGLLVVEIQQHRVSYPEGVISQELEVFEYEHTRTGVRYTAPQGYHDDAVCALALACKAYRDRFPLLSAAIAPAEILRVSPWLGGNFEFGD
ncbi:conserved hypothetical protein [uncultured Pleomorphomonas sp.]|uniref:Uncharacterized protein n=1 Tax=uncultured Pleomorphomonas sp. TaxID=442121 RepID=A0A212L2G9_9HYPH|nr:terminase family protein [uncultured Pleomorphomonas sp.]SCM71549.1 conserved hypothetical protein [uncultured Pleomorphomonas sp.]